MRIGSCRKKTDVLYKKTEAVELFNLINPKSSSLAEIKALTDELLSEISTIRAMANARPT